MSEFAVMPSLFGIGVYLMVREGGDVLKEAGVKKKKIIEIRYLCKLS